MGKQLEKIQDLLLIPMIQTIVKYAYKLENYSPNEHNVDLAMAEVATLSVLPVLDFYSNFTENKNAIYLITKNMLIQKNVEPVKDGGHEVVKALKTIFPLLNVSCALFGKIEGNTLCDEDEFIKAESKFEIDYSSDASGITYRTIIFLFVTVNAFFVLS